MKKTLFIIAFLASFIAANSQMASDFVNETSNEETKAYNIVFQLTTADTMAHKALMKQIGNITSVAPETKIEVVCHGPGLTMLQPDKSVVTAKLEGYAKKGILFSACEFSMSERNVKKEEITPAAGYVKAGILHIVSRQAEGWFYIKAGF